MTMLRPALSFMAFPLSNALSIQGITLIVGHLFGPIAVTVFNTYRTISRIAVQITSIFSNALWAEFSQLFGKNKITELSHLFKRSQLIGITAATLLSVATFFLGPYILEFWTHGRIGFEASHFGILLADLSKWNIASSLLAFGMAYLFGRLFGIDGVAMAMLVSEAAIAFICIKLANDVLTQATSRAQP
jgi:O-antigen/teichoic acid export membrane protein